MQRLVKCDCNLFAEYKTSHTPSNPNRIFYRCANPMKDQKCKFWSWADELQPAQYSLTPAISQVPGSPTTPLRQKRTLSVVEEPFDFTSPSQKRTKVIETALGAGGSSRHPGAPSISFPYLSNAVGGTPQALPSVGGVPAASPQTPTRSDRTLATCSPSPSPEPLESVSQQCKASTAEDNLACPLSSGELTPESIGNMVDVLGTVPDYIRKSEKKRIMAEKGLDVRNKKIEYLEDEVKRLKGRQKELELIIAGYESKGF